MTADVYRLADETNTSVAAVCRVFGLARSTVYARKNRPPSKRARETAALDVEIKAIHAESASRYGSPRVHQQLKRKGRRVSRKRVEARMRALGLQAGRPKRFRRTTRSNPRHKYADNILARRFHWERPNQAWCGDVTFIWTQEGWAYLAILVDLCTRAIVGWAVSRHCDSDLTRRCLQNAVARHRPRPGLVHHTDRGSTYTEHDYRALVRAHGMLESMSAKGDCWDNAVSESTFSTIKGELFGEHVPSDLSEVEHALFPYVEGFYNRKRLHSSIDYMTPEEKYRLALSAD